MKKIFLFIFLVQVKLFSQNSLLIGTGAEVIACGEAVTSFKSDNSVLYNPASLKMNENFRTTFSHTLGFGNTSTNSISLNFGKETTGVSILLQSTSITDIEYRILPGEPIGNFTYRFLFLQGTYATSFWENTIIGVSLKTSYEKIFVDDAFGIFFNLGLLNKINNQLTIGASILNSGANSKFYNTVSKPPTTFRVGADYKIFENLNLLCDVVTTKTQNTKYNFGGIYNLGFVTAMAGYQLGYDVKAFTFGFNLKYSNMKINFGYQPLNYELGSIQSYDVSIEL